MSEEQQFEMVERIVLAHGGTLAMFPIDVPECLGGMPQLHACFDGVCVPVNRAYCVSESMFRYWLGQQLRGPLMQSA